MADPKKVLAIIMGGGRGTRLYPLTKERCKPAVPLAGKYRLVDIPISNCINSGYNRIFLLTQFLTASLHRHLQKSFHFDPFNGGFVDILSAEQTEKSNAWYEGTADAVRRNLVHFNSHAHDLILILSGDQLYRMDFRKIIEQHIETKADVTIAAIPFPVSKVEGLGLMRVNDDLSISEFVEKPKDPAVINSLTLSPSLEEQLSTKTGEKHCLASMGIYVFSRDALRRALDNSAKDFGKEVIPGMLGKGKLCAHIFEGYWEDIGTVRAFFDANLALAQPLGHRDRLAVDVERVGGIRAGSLRPLHQVREEVGIDRRRRGCPLRLPGRRLLRGGLFRGFAGGGLFCFRHGCRSTRLRVGSSSSSTDEKGI